MIRRLLAFLLCAGALVASGSAQVVANLRMDRTQFVAGEPVNAVVTLTNHSGQDLLLQTSGRQPWLDFIIKKEGGLPVAPIQALNFGAAQIPMGQTMSRSIDLAKYFRLHELGSFSVYAVVRLPGQTTEGSLSNRLLFTVTTLRPYWQQKVGVPGKPGQINEYRVLTFAGAQTTKLLVQVADTRTGLPLQTVSFGDMLTFRKPQITLDSQQNLHVLYLVTPTMWAHGRVDPNGNLLGRDLHKRGGGSDPQLMAQADGSVQVGGGIPYDPNAQQQMMSKFHKLSERPTMLYD